MEYSILDSSGKVVALASSASDAKAKLEKGRCVFGQQTVVDQTGASVEEGDLDRLSAAEERADSTAA